MENLFLDPFTILLIAGFIGFFMAFGNWVPMMWRNSMGTSVGSIAITINTTIFIAAIFEFFFSWWRGYIYFSHRDCRPILYDMVIIICGIGMMSDLLEGDWLVH